MKYIQPKNQIDNAPYIDGDPTDGTVGSIVPAAAIEHPQRELLAIIEGADEIPDGEELNQVYLSIKKLIAAAVEGTKQELDAIIEGAGNTPNEGEVNQLYSSIKQLSAAAVEGTKQELDAIITGAGNTPNEGEVNQLYLSIKQLSEEISRKLCAPAGQIVMWGGGINNVPNGFLPCDGRWLYRSQYPDLFDAIGKIHRSTTSSSGFYLPNLQDRFVIGRSNAREVGRTGGSFTKSKTTQGHRLTINEMPPHKHNLRSHSSSDANNYGLGYNRHRPIVGGPATANKTLSWFSTNRDGTDLMQTTGGNQLHSHAISNFDVTNPYYSLIYMIRT